MDDVIDALTKPSRRKPWKPSWREAQSVNGEIGRSATGKRRLIRLPTADCAAMTITKPSAAPPPASRGRLGRSHARGRAPPHARAGLDRVHLYARLGDELPAEQRRRSCGYVDRRLAHEPTPYIIGHKEFFALDFEVTPAALIPRPETETLVELALLFARAATPKHSTIADIGTGSGAIAVSLAHALPNAARHRHRRLGGSPRPRPPQRRTPWRSEADRLPLRRRTRPAERTRSTSLSPTCRT